MTIMLPKVAGCFFAKHTEYVFFYAIMRCVLFKGTDKVYIIDDKTFGGPLF